MAQVHPGRTTSTSYRRKRSGRKSGRTISKQDSSLSEKRIFAGLTPQLVALLAQPEVRLLMQADRVDEQELLRSLAEVSIRLLEDDDLHSSEESRPGYRLGVGIILLNSRGEVLVGRRVDVKDAWQLPQGGINTDESPIEAARRELREEIGTDAAEVVAESKHWLQYDVPVELARRWGGRWKGQRQKWFVMAFQAQDADIDVATEHPEFDAWQWVSVNKLVELAVSFKRELYASILAEFSTIFRD